MASMKRMTLSTLGDGALNSRPSLGARLGAPGVKPVARGSLGKRESLDKRQSLSTKHSQAIKKLTDPRPISDRAFMNQSIRAIIAYLSTHGYNAAISPKMLLAPSTKDFRFLLEFLVRQIDQNFQFTGKFEEEVPIVFKRLGYPFPISKSALMSVGSPHGWPHLLAGLSWIVELLNYGEEVSSTGGLGEEEEGERLFFDFLRKAYGEFMNGKDDLSALEEDLVGTFKAKNDALEGDVSRIEQRNAEMRAEIERLKTTETPLQAIKRTNGDLAADTAKFKTLIANLQQHKVTAEKKEAQIINEVVNVKAEADSARAEADQLARLLAAQDISAADVERMNKDRNQLEEALRAATAQREAVQHAIWEAEGDIHRRIEELERSVHGYNSRAAVLQLIPATAKYARGRELELRINQSAANVADMTNVDLRGVVKPAIDALKEVYSRKIEATQVAVVEAREGLERSREAVAERREAVKALEVQLAKAEQALQQEKDGFEENLRAIAEETEGTEAAIAETKESSNRAVADAQAEIVRLQAEVEAVRRACEAEREALNDCLLTTLDVLTTHKANVQDALQVANQTAQDVLQEIINL